LYSAKGDRLVPMPGKSWKTWNTATAADLPVRGIDFNSAQDYCRWRGERLPTESEWEYVARGSDRRMFAWGNEARTNSNAQSGGPLPVDQQPATGRFGNRGMGDGLLEWVDAGASGGESDRVLRGSSWLDTNSLNQRLALRRLLGPTQALLDSGVRCAKSTDSWPDEMLGG
jgi:formylglycine-generating enzyme required for sulfatase activity